MDSILHAQNLEQPLFNDFVDEIEAAEAVTEHEKEKYSIFDDPVFFKIIIITIGCFICLLFAVILIKFCKNNKKKLERPREEVYQSNGFDQINN